MNLLVAKCLRCLLLCLIVMAATPSVWSQNITGAIDGVVTDSSGALVPGATVLISNLATKQVARTVTSNSHGEYSASLLAVGDYSLAVSAPGFQNTDIPIVSVDVGETATTNVSLKPGNVNVTTTVNADEVAPNVETPENSAVINATEMKELALNTRNFEQILLIQPGVSYTGPDQLASGLVDANGATNPHALSVNGLQPTQLAFNFDGADTLDRVTIAQSVLFPSVDSINQIKVLRDSYGAQYGGGGSAQVIIVSKAGGSAYHGDAYYFLRNQYLNANEFFNLISSPVLPRPATRYNDFGFSVGGPFFIPGIYPKNRSKTYFFYSQELRRIQLNPTSQQGNYPYVAEANGYFIAPVCVPAGTPGAVTSGIVNGVSYKFGCPTSPPATNSPYPGFNWQIPTSAFSPIAQQYLKDIILPALALQQPNSPSVANAVVLDQKSITNSNQILGRIDHQFNSRLSGFFRYIFDPYHLQVPDGYNQANGFPGVNTSNIYTYGENFLGHMTFTATQNTVLDFGYSYLPYEIKSTVIGFASSAVSPDIQVQSPYLNTLPRVPTISINGQKWGPNGPIRTLNHTQQAFENTTKQLGQHTLQFGVNYEHYYARTNQGTLNAGLFTFDQGASGLPVTAAKAANGVSPTSAFESSFSGFLTGVADTFTQESIDPVSYIASSLYEAYVQDNWRALPHFTVQAGMRWSFTGQPYDKGGHLGVFQPQAYNPGEAPNIAFADGEECLTGNTDSNCNGIAPNSNYNPLNGIVQGGINSPYGQSVVRHTFLNFAPRVGFAWDVYGNGKTSLRGGYGIFYNQIANTIAEQQVQGNPAYVSTTTFNSPSFANPGGGTNPNFIPNSISGSNRNWTSPYTQSYSLDIQQQFGPSFVVTFAYVGNKTFHLQGVEDINQPLPGEWVTAGVNYSGAARGASAAKVNLLNPIRPYLGYESINFFDTRYFADYNGLQVGLVKSFPGLRGAHLNMNYTWSKAMANSSGFSSGPQNTYSLVDEWGPTSSDRRNIFNTSLVYLLPFYREQKGITGKLLGGYEVAAIITAVSGLWQTAGFTQSDPAGQGFESGVTDSVERPDQNANPNQSAPHSVSEYFNINAFSFVPTGQARPGNEQVGSILGPGYDVWNVSLDRNFDLPKDLRFQFRVEAFNLFNHVNFLNVNTNFNNADFGVVTSARDNRQLQLGAKLYF